MEKLSLVKKENSSAPLTVRKVSSEKVIKRPHSVTIENRESASLSGVEKVISSSDSTVNLVTSGGGLTLSGRGFRIERFDAADGNLVLCGSVDSLKYSAAKVPFLKRIFS